MRGMRTPAHPSLSVDPLFLATPLVHTFAGSYGDYLLGKIGKVFPELQQQVL